MNKNNQIRYAVENGDYIVSKNYNEDIEGLQGRMLRTQYSYLITANKIFKFITKNLIIELPLAEVEWRIFWDKLGNVPINEDEELEVPFEHFEAGTNREDIWHWFESYFNISLGKELFK